MLLKHGRDFLTRGHGNAEKSICSSRTRTSECVKERHTGTVSTMAKAKRPPGETDLEEERVRGRQVANRHEELSERHRLLQVQQHRVHCNNNGYTATTTGTLQQQPELKATAGAKSLTRANERPVVGSSPLLYNCVHTQPQLSNAFFCFCTPSSGWRLWPRGRGEGGTGTTPTPPCAPPKETSHNNLGHTSTSKAKPVAEIASD